MPERSIEAAKERGWREIAAIDAALEKGEIDEEGWHRAMADLVVPAYLAAANPRAQSGHSGDEARWRYARELLLDAIDRGGSFLDVGCAGGLLMESISEWAAERGLSIEPYGLDISPELAALARSGLPRWANRIFVGNALHWEPARRFDFVRTGIEYASRHRRRDLLQHLLHRVVVPGGRLIVGVFNEEREAHHTEKLVSDWATRSRAGQSGRTATSGSRTARSGSIRPSCGAARAARGRPRRSGAQPSGRRRFGSNPWR